MSDSKCVNDQVPLLPIIEIESPLSRKDAEDEDEKEKTELKIGFNELQFENREVKTWFQNRINALKYKMEEWIDKQQPLLNDLINLITNHSTTTDAPQKFQQTINIKKQITELDYQSIIMMNMRSEMIERQLQRWVDKRSAQFQTRRSYVTMGGIIIGMLVCIPCILLFFSFSFLPFISIFLFPFVGGTTSFIIYTIWILKSGDENDIRSFISMTMMTLKDVRIILNTLKLLISSIRVSISQTNYFISTNHSAPPCSSPIPPLSSLPPSDPHRYNHYLENEEINSDNNFYNHHLHSPLPSSPTHHYSGEQSGEESGLNCKSGNDDDDVGGGNIEMLQIVPKLSEMMTLLDNLHLHLTSQF